MSNKIPDFSNASLSASFRHWLIKLVAGKHTVVLNARLSIVPDDGVHHAMVTKVDGLMICNSVFPIAYGKMVEVSQVKRPKAEVVGYRVTQEGIQ